MIENRLNTKTLQFSNGDMNICILITQKYVRKKVSVETLKQSLHNYCVNMHSCAVHDIVSIILLHLFRSFMGINPERGSKCKGKTRNIHPRLLQLTNALKDFENVWGIQSDFISVSFFHFSFCIYFHFMFLAWCSYFIQRTQYIAQV